MFWLYFVRDFYRATNTSTALYGAGSSNRIIAQTAAIAFRRHEPRPAATKPLRSTSLSVRSAPQPESVEPSPAHTTHHYLNRLSVEGDHAFGVWDEESGFSLFSANFERVTGLSSGECAGHDWIHAIHHTHQYAINEALLAAQKGVDGRSLVQAQSITRDEQWRWLMVDIKAATPRQPAVMVLFRDLTEQTALEEALRQTESALALSERGRKAFLSSMSHELRTPLNAIMGFSEMMKTGVFGTLENDTYAQYAHHIHDSGSALLTKINDLLEIASIESGGLALMESEFHLVDLLAEAIEIHSHAAFARGQQLKLDCPLADIEVRADRSKILCAITHMLANALRHSPDGAAVTVGVRHQPGDGIILSVRDHGEGIPPAQLESIRTALTTNATYYHIESGSIGLGLSLTKELTERHGGQVMIDSIRHRGTVVSILIPTSRIVAGLPLRKGLRLETNVSVQGA